MSKKSIFQWTVVGAFFFAIGFTYEYHLPQIESWLLVKVEEITAKKSPVQLIPKNLKLTLLPLGVVLEDVHVLPKETLAKALAPARLSEVALSLNLWSLIRGEFRLSRVVLRNSEITVFVRSDEPKKKEPKKPLNFNLDELQQIPIDEIELQNMTIMGRVDPQGLVFKVTNLDLNVVNLYNSLYVYFGSPNMMFKPSGPYPTLDFEAQGRGLLESNELRISAFKLKSHESFVVASGLLNGDLLGGDITTGRFSLRTHLELGNVDAWMRVLPNPPKLPKLKGLFDFNAELAYKGATRNPDVSLSIETHDFQIDQFKFGKLSGRANGDLRKIVIDELAMENSAGKAVLRNVNLELKPQVKFHGDVDIVGLELRRLLLNLGVPETHLHLDLKGRFPCKGEASPFLITCEGELGGANLEVRGGGGKRTIVKAKQFALKGSTQIDASKVTYKGEARMGKKSKGRSEGVIDYEKGFQIQFQGDVLEFADIDNLVDLKLEGEGQVKGSTEGDSERATVQMDVQTKNFWFEDFGVGALTSNVSYKTGHLYLKEIEGHYGTSRYSGNIDIDLLENQIVAQTKMPFMDLKDLREILMRRLPIPVEVAGTGTGQAKVWGPLDITKLNYAVKSQFFRGKIANEDFDTLRFDIDGDNGVAKARRIHLTKANGQLEMRGILRPEWTIDSVLVGHGLRLEQSDLITSLGLDLQGQADFNFVLRGPIRTPRMELNGRLSKVVIADAPQEDSTFRMDFTATQLAGSGNFLGAKVITQFVLPLDPKATFSFDLKTNKWDFTNIFTLVSRSSQQMDFQTSLTMDAKLRAPEGGFWNSTGVVEVRELKLRHGAQSMQSEAPMRLNFKSGVISSSENFGISSGENYLKLHVAGLSRDHLNADMNGKMDLSMLGLLTPFISDLRGNLSLNVNLRGTRDHPLLSGSTFIDKAYVKLRDFIHPFSNVRADLLFNQQTLLINAFRSELGGGRLTGDGKITFVARDNVPVDVRATATDISVNIPEGYKTRGSGTVAIKGQKFPYQMAIKYDVQGGDITAEFATQENDGTIKASTYLPKFAAQETFEPFRYDVEATLKRPILVSNTLLQTQVQGQIRARGTPDHLLLNGTVTPVPGGKFLFRDTPFEINSGYVEYNDYPPENPRVYLTATAHVKQVVSDYVGSAPTGGTSASQSRQVENTYDVSLLVQGRAQPAPQITLTSQPPLSQRDLVSLLALGMTPDALDERKSSTQQAANTAIGAALLQQPVGRKLKESLGVDVKLSSTPTTTNTLSSSDSAGSTVTLTKQFTPKFSVSASSTFGTPQTNGVKTEYKVNRNVSVVGSWEEKTGTSLQDKKDVSSDIFGLDLEYKLPFK